MAASARVALPRRLRSSWAKNPMRSFSARAPSSAVSDSRWELNCATALPIASSRQRFRVWNSTMVIGAPASRASSVIAWEMSP